MRLNLLATTAAAAIIASGGMWAQAQTSGAKQDKKAQVHEQKGAENQYRAHDEKARADQAPGTHQAEDGQQKRNALGPMNAKKGDGSTAAEQARSEQPSTAAENQNIKSGSNERHRRNAASGVNKGNEQDSRTNASTEGKANKDQNSAPSEGKTQLRAEQPTTGNQTAAQSQQSKSGNQLNTSGGVSKAGTAANQPAKNPKRNTPSSPQKAGSTNQQTGSTSNKQTNNTASTTLTEGDRSKVFSTLKSDRRSSNQRVDIEVNVGERLPARVHPRPLPRTVVEVLPQYRGYEFVMVRDEIAIVRPGTREVVDVIHKPGSSSSFAARSMGGSRTTINLTDQQRTKLRTEARRFTSSQVSSRGSQCLSLQPVPASLANENPDLKQYQMLAIGEDIVLINPNSKKVVEVIQ